MTITYEGATEQTQPIIHHHAMLRRGLERRADPLCEAVESGVPFGRQMTILRDYLTDEILPLPAHPSAGADLAALLAGAHQPRTTARA